VINTGGREGGREREKWVVLGNQVKTNGAAGWEVKVGSINKYTHELRKCPFHVVIVFIFRKYS